MTETLVLEKDGLQDGEEMEKARPETLSHELYFSKVTFLTPADILKIPTKMVNGDLSLRDLLSVPEGGLELPETVNGDLDLFNLKSAVGLKLPITVNGSLYLSGLTSLEGLKLPETVKGIVYVRGLQSSERDELEKMHPELKII
jgi:hypothetical protein